MQLPPLKYSIHLVISVLIVVPVALIYGFKTNLYFDINLNTLDEHNFVKAIMGLYIRFSGLWVLGIVNKQYLKIATITNVIFMFGLGLGRLLSFFVDGLPTTGYVFGTFGELFLGCYGVWFLYYNKF